MLQQMKVMELEIEEVMMMTCMTPEGRATGPDQSPLVCSHPELVYLTWGV